ncbi:acyl-CoA dehydrogenase family protein [Actinokineospora spheciospongiae]|uniref:acyl-CoA dehydrogenase family protein n=1 Tax=Actinokineospora spheciospongiae TaxID=909613 RepID=UPI000D71C6F0|nr:acyl-CoA dehydrogenase family protein [Actinokineospora spheciospongiae]PWW53117.1 acyl-CoA dehydrogenase-like protein [Actinokineospora spheciospongiae]
MSGEAIDLWLHPLRHFLDPAGTADWPRLVELATALDEALVNHPLGPALLPGQQRSQRLLGVRRALVADRGFGEQPPLWQLLAQFVCGYRDLDLRDATGLGHGRLIARHGTDRTRTRWLPRLTAGELAGVAITEPHGGTRVGQTRAHAIISTNGTLLLSGRKCWISRLSEAAVFVVFFRDPHGRLAAAAVDAADPGLRRTLVPPSGLAGWSWGVLDLHQVRVHPDDVLRGDGMTLLREHFATYRPWVTATALGGAAAVFDSVTTALAGRDIDRIWDNALITIGRTHVQLTTALLGCAVAAHLAEQGHAHAEAWGAATKAHGVDTAHTTTAELALLLGAAGFRHDTPIAKTRRDLAGLLFADGIHDSLYRSAGRTHTTTPITMPVQRENNPATPATPIKAVG